MTGRTFKVETLGAVDGPGLRLVLFLQGCNLRCPYCHNPESWETNGGSPLTADEVMTRLMRYRGYYKGGGITISGGEPLMQAGFVREVLRRCREAGVHTALDTAAAVLADEARAALTEADLLLLDIKSADPDAHQRLFGLTIEAPLAALHLRQAAGKPVWIRQVVAPYLNDTEADMERLAGLISDFSCIERVELLPFRKLCLEKYEAMGIAFPMAHVAEMDGERIAELAAHLKKHLPAFVAVS